MVATISPDNLRVVLSMLDDIVLTRYLAGVALTLVIYDSIILIQTEYQTIWKSQWTFPKMLYYFIRALTIPTLAVAAYDMLDFKAPVSNRFCQIWLPLISVPMLVSLAASNWLFTLRLIALYKQQRVLVWFMRTFYALTYTVDFIFLIVTLVTYDKLGVYYNPASKTCYTSMTIPYSGPIFFVPLVYEVLIFTLTVYRAHKDAIIRNKSSTQLLIVLYRDNALAFFIMLALRSWNIWIYATQPVSSLHIATNIYWAVNTVLTTRIYLNIVWFAHASLAATNPAVGTELSSISSKPPRGVSGIQVGSRNSQPQRLTFQYQKYP